MEIQKKSTEDYSNKGTKEDDIKKKSFPPPPTKKSLKIGFSPAVQIIWL